MARKTLLPLVSIVVPVFNSKNYYKNFIKSLKKVSSVSFEVLIIDDGSTDGSFALIKREIESDKRFKLFATDRRLGIPGSRNYGINLSKGLYLAFSEIDMEFNPKWLSQSISVLENSLEIAAITPKVLDVKKKQYIQAAGIMIIPHTGGVVGRGFGQLDNKKFDKPAYTSMGSVGVVVRRESVQRIKGYDEALGRVDDLDFGWRVWLSGGRVLYNPNSIVYHWSAKPISMRNNEVKQIDIEFDLTKGIRSMIKNLELSNLILFLPQAILIMLIRSFLNLLKGNYTTLIGVSKGIIWNIKVLPDTLSKRAEIQRNRQFSDSYLFGKAILKGSFIEIYNKFMIPSFEKSRKWYKEK